MCVMLVVCQKWHNIVHVMWLDEIMMTNFTERDRDGNRRDDDQIVAELDGLKKPARLR